MEFTNPQFLNTLFNADQTSRLSTPYFTQINQSNYFTQTITNL